MTREPDCTGDRMTLPAAEACVSPRGRARAPSLATCWTYSASRPMDAVYAWVQDEDLGEVRCQVTLRTLLYPNAALPAARLPSRIQEPSLLAVCAQVGVWVVKEGTSLSAHDAVVEEQLAYAISDMVMVISDDSP